MLFLASMIKSRMLPVVVVSTADERCPAMDRNATVTMVHPLYK